MTRSPSIRWAVKEAGPGRCIGCDVALHGRKRVLCGDAECMRLYQRLFALDRWSGQLERINETLKRITTFNAHH